MKRLPLAAMVLLAAALVSGGAHAQARGPAAAEVQETGQDVPSLRDLSDYNALRTRQSIEQVEREREAMRDPAIHAAMLAELDSWFRRLPGRFRIDGLIEMVGGAVPWRMQGTHVLKGKVSGVADCAGIGAGVGVQCVFNATWPIIDDAVAAIGEKVGDPQDPRSPVSGAEVFRSFNPAVMVIGLSLDPPGIRAQLVTGDSLSHILMGWLSENTGTAIGVNRALPLREVASMEIIAEPQSDVVTIRMVGGLFITLTLTMYRDPEARAEKPLKPLQAR